MAMNPERWARVGEILDRALEADPAEREALVEDLCAGDEQLRREVLEYVESFALEGETLDRPLALRTLASDIGSLAGDPIGLEVGGYRILRRIGAGGMGVVYEAERADRAFRKRAAVKLLRRGPGDSAARARFLQEIRILASLEHPHVARLIDGGVTEAGDPFLVMEHVEGEPIDQWCRARALSVRERVRLFLGVCEAVQYAHRNLVVHRDLKPGNVLISADGKPRLLDFGVAKLLASDDGEAALTGEAPRPFTPAYACPELLRGEPDSTATDVYALGVLLYELLAGRRPFSDDISPLALARRTETEPQPPSLRLSAEAWGESLDRARRDIAGDLDHVVAKAMKVEPERRYPTVDRLAEDLRRWLDGLPVEARPDAWSYRMRKFVARHRAAVAAAAIAALAVAGGVATTTWQARRAVAEARHAAEERARAETVSRYLQRMIWSASPGWATPGERVGPDVTIAELLETIEQTAGSELASQPAIEAPVRRMLGIAYFYMARYPDAAVQAEMALRLDREAYGPLHYDVAHDLEVLADAKGLWGDAEGSRPHYEEALEIFRRVGAEPDTQLFFIATLSNYGSLEYMTGRLDHAEALLLEALARSRRDLGPGHAIEAIVTTNLGNVEAARADYAGATRWLERSLEIWRATPGRRRFEEANALASLARVRMEEGRLAAADSLLAPALEILERTPPTLHILPYGLRSTEALLHERGGDLDRAETAARAALAAIEGKVRPDHPHVATAETMLGRIVTARGRAAEAEPLLRRALAIRERHLPPDSWWLAETRAALGAALLDLGRREEAMPLLRVAHPILAAEIGPTHPLTTETGRRLREVVE
jgi:tetratricopeptide (TPR) repeat protein/tRNA A-37 threonylcarbamoyl transferase component Bud32